MTSLAIIGGSGLGCMPDLHINEQKRIDTPFGPPTADLILGTLNSVDVAFLARHGNPHRIPPHKINYRANIWVLKELGIRQIIAVAAVGAIHRAMPPGHIVIPEQIIDYSYGREHTFFAENLATVTHIDFTRPYSEPLRQRLLAAARQAGLECSDFGVYGCTQGPRLETAAEIQRMRRDGCDLVGMTGMPEAALARELEMDYACCAVVANWAAGLQTQEISMSEIERNLQQGMHQIEVLIRQVAANLYQ